MIDCSEADRLAQLIAAKKQVLELLAQLAARQARLIDNGEISGLLKLLAAKQTVIAQLQQLERLLDGFRQQDPELRTWRSTEDRQRCQQTARECELLLSEVVRLEQLCEKEMIRRRDTAAEALEGFGDRADAQHAYALPLPCPAPAQLEVQG